MAPHRQPDEPEVLARHWTGSGQPSRGTSLLVSFLFIAFLLRKAFSSWLCPVGTLSECLWRAGRRTLGRNFHLTRWLDLPLRSLKYLLLGFFAWAVANLSAGATEQFMRSPYGAMADVRMLNFFRDLGETAAIVLGILVLGFGSGAELLVPLLMSLWCMARHGVPAEPLAHPSLGGRLHGLCPVRQGVPLSLAGRQTGHDQVGRVHRLPGVCCGLPVRRRVATGSAPLDARSQGRPRARLGDGRGNCSFVLRKCWVRQDVRILERRSSGLCLPAACATRQRRWPPSGVVPLTGTPPS
jgi:hypothetical protein